MKEKYKNLLVQLVKEKRFPLNPENLTEEEKNLIVEMLKENTKEEVKDILELIKIKEALK